jgi:hypothetical protein
MIRHKHLATRRINSERRRAGAGSEPNRFRVRPGEIDCPNVPGIILAKKVFFAPGRNLSTGVNQPSDNHPANAFGGTPELEQFVAGVRSADLEDEKAGILLVIRMKGQAEQPGLI